MRTGAILLLAAVVATGQNYPLTDPATVTSKAIEVAAAEFLGQKCLRVQEVAGQASGGAEAGIALLKGGALHNGSIEIEVASTLSASASGAARGFIGVAFRVSPDASRYEYIYLRPTNGRADDQVRRNHSTQYSSHPDYPWQRMRKEFPEMYESYVDLEPGVWTKMKIVLKGNRAELYVHGGAQPVLVARDLKLGDTGGGIALWTGPGTIGYFRNLTVKAE